MKTGRALGELALEWTKQGVPVFPCSVNKTPLTVNGFKDASTNPSIVLQMFEDAGSAAVYIGAAMGKAAHLFAIDCDTYKDGEAGEAARQYEQYLKEHGLLPETRVHKTVSGGVHYIYYSDDAWPNCKPSKGVEVKGEGGYIIVPPSPGYEVVSKGLATAPRKLLLELGKAKEATSQATISELKSLILSAESFHDPLVQIAARRANQGWEQERIQNELLNTMSASVARMPDHPRHARWRSIIHDTQGELNRAASSAERKYNANTAADKLREAANLAGKFFRPEGEPEIKSAEDYEGTWPFEGGYFFEDKQNVLDQKYIAYPIIAEGETTLIYADPKAGKTLFTHTLAIHIAAGRPLSDRIWINEARPVLYFSLEGQVAVKRRQEAWKARHPNIKSLPLYIHERPVNLADEAVRKDFVNKVVAAERFFSAKGDAPIGAIVIDTLTKTMPGRDQNSVEDTSAVFEVIGRLRAEGVKAAVLFIHHKNRANSGPRGSGNIMAEPDTLLTIEKTDTGQIKLSVAMARSVDDDFGSVYFNISTHDLGKSSQGFPISAPVLSPAVAVVEKKPTEDEANSLRASKNEATILMAIVGMGVGRHGLKQVHVHIIASGVEPHIYPLALKARMQRKKLEEYFIDLITTNGRLFGNYALSICKGDGGAELQIAKVVAPTGATEEAE